MNNIFNVQQVYCIHFFLHILQNITADIAYRKPDEPIQFMIDEIEKLQEMDRRRKGVILRKTPETKSQESGYPTENLLSNNQNMLLESEIQLTDT